MTLNEFKIKRLVMIAVLILLAIFIVYKGMKSKTPILKPTVQKIK
jgi:hypothetical protein